MNVLNGQFASRPLTHSNPRCFLVLFLKTKQTLFTRRLRKQLSNQVHCRHPQQQTQSLNIILILISPIIHQTVGHIACFITPIGWTFLAQSKAKETRLIYFARTGRDKLREVD